MEKATLTAFEESIKHWEENAEIVDIDEAKISVADCALCELFYHKYRCSGCPVAERTGQEACRGTPYYAALEAYQDEDLPAFIEAAKAELSFLKSLLPPETLP